MRIIAFLLCLSAWLDTTAATLPPHGVVLMYHRFGEDRYPATNVRLAQFASQLDLLQHEGFHIWPLRKLIRTLLAGEPIPDKTVSLTVDDAYLSVYENAYPLVRERGVPLTVFVSTDAVDRGLQGFSSWSRMREMQAHGIDFANHGASHAHLTKRLAGETEAMWRQRVTDDIDKAQRRLEEELGAAELRLFAYPFGEFDAALGKLIRELGYIGFGQHSGAIGPLSGLHALPRFPINERYSAPDTFALKVASLPLPVTGQPPQDPTVGVENPPRLNLRLATGEEALAGRISCFLGNGTPLTVQQSVSGEIGVQAPAALGPGRHRYNCTAPAGKGRFYWFSQPWQNGPDAADPAD